MEGREGGLVDICGEDLWRTSGMGVDLVGAEEGVVVRGGTM